MKSKRTSDGRKLDHTTLQAMRQQAVKAVREGQDVASVAAAYGVNERSVYRWLADFANGGQRVIPPFSTAEKRGVVTANRTKAVLSLVLNCGRLWDMMTIANPRAGVRGKKETGRQDILIDDELYASVHAVADEPLRNAMDLADLCAQRPADILGVQRSNNVKGNLIFRTRKTKAFVTIQITGELEKLIERLLAWRGSKVDVSPYLLRDEEGDPLTRASCDRGSIRRAIKLASTRRNFSSATCARAA